MSEPLVSIIIPAYNREDTICTAVNSALGQTYANKEIIVVDDGSTDGTCDKLKGFDGKIRFIQQQNSGPSAARNAGVSASQGEILFFLDSDDLWLPSKTTRQVSLLESLDSSIPCCLCNTLILRNSGEKTTSFDLAPIRSKYDSGIWLNVTSILSTRCVLFTQAAAIKRWAFEKVSGFDESLKIMEDHDLALRLSLEGPWAFITEPLAIYHHGNAGSLAEEARHNELYLCKSIDRIMSNMLSDRRTKEMKARKYLSRNHTRMHRYIERSQSDRSSDRKKAMMNKSLDAARQVLDFTFRHSPLYPKMKAASIGGVRG
jgi:glycosyltransferase involved in cell wall biosynthesis